MIGLVDILVAVVLIGVVILASHRDLKRQHYQAAL